MATIVHILDAGLPLCGFSSAVPRDWPEEHRWVPIDDRTPLHQLGNVDRNEPPVRCAGCEEQRAKIAEKDSSLSRLAR